MGHGRRSRSGLQTPLTSTLISVGNGEPLFLVLDSRGKRSPWWERVWAKSRSLRAEDTFARRPLGAPPGVGDKVLLLASGVSVCRRCFSRWQRVPSFQRCPEGSLGEKLLWGTSRVLMIQARGRLPATHREYRAPVTTPVTSQVLMQ